MSDKKERTMKAASRILGIIGEYQWLDIDESQRRDITEDIVNTILSLIEEVGAIKL